MKNFLGRIIILINSIINCALFFILIGVFLFFSFNETNSLMSFLHGQSTNLEYVGIAVALLDFLLLIITTVVCIIGIINGRRMKHALIVSSLFFGYNLFTFLFNLFIPHIDNVYTGILISVMVALIVTSIMNMVGSAFNLHKDCR